MSPQLAYRAARYHGSRSFPARNAALTRHGEDEAMTQNRTATIILASALTLGSVLGGSVLGGWVLGGTARAA